MYIFISLGKRTGAVLVSFDGDIFAYPGVICIAMQPWHTYFCRKEGTFLLVITNCFFFLNKDISSGSNKQWDHCRVIVEKDAGCSGWLGAPAEFTISCPVDEMPWNFRLHPPQPWSLLRGAGTETKVHLRIYTYVSRCMNLLGSFLGPRNINCITSWDHEYEDLSPDHN